LKIIDKRLVFTLLQTKNVLAKFADTCLRQNKCKLKTGTPEQT